MLIAELIVALALVVAASDAFTNAVEWLGARFDLTRSAAGAIVAAIGSSLPETIIAIIALLVLRDPRSQAIGIGAVLGAPFTLSTLVFCLIGSVALARGAGTSGKALAVPAQPTIFGAALFAATFAVALAASFARAFWVHAIAAAIVLGAYGVYLAYHLRGGVLEGEPSPAPLRFAPRSKEPALWLVVVQVIAALTITVLASRWFVVAVSKVALALGLLPFIVSLFLSPIATELPEASNVIVWMRRREDSLAMSNVLGAMMFQTSVASAIAMLATPWHLELSAYASATAALVAVFILLISTIVRREVRAHALTAAGLLYLGYVLYIASR